MMDQRKKDAMPSVTRTLTTVLALLAVLSTGCATKYAVLISTDTVTTDDVQIHSEWWYDLFLQYKMLKDKGFNEDDIYVLYANGSDFNTSHSEYNSITQFGHSITDMAMSKANVTAVFTTLSSKVDSNDHLYVWWMGHGSGSSSCNTTMLIGTSGETMTDAEFAAAINLVAAYGKREVSMMTCYSGGLIDNLGGVGTNTVVLTSSECNQLSYDAATTCNGYFHAEFNYTDPSGLGEEDPCGTGVSSDSDGNGSVSLSEAHNYNMATMLRSTPQMGDADGIASTTWIDKKNP